VPRPKALSELATNTLFLYPSTDITSIVAFPSPATMVNISPTVYPSPGCCTSTAKTIPVSPVTGSVTTFVTFTVQPSPVPELVVANLCVPAVYPVPP
jgi:hypothetical protein